ncbi:MAG: carboxypeptidase-like regulatory domain-containing protein [Chitinophagaceae bacterium]
MKFLCHLLLTSLLISSCSKSSKGSAAEDTTWKPQPDLPVISGSANFTIPASGHYVNVMGSSIPRMPVYPTLKVKQNFARGYVADLTGKPLKGAHIGINGYYASQTAVTDNNGYYEFKLPPGASYFFGTATTITYNETTAVVALYPADGSVRLPSGEGVVKNFVLLSYGPANPDEVGQQPNNETNYYGGAVYFNFNINYSSDPNPTAEYLPSNGIIEIELIPLECLYGERKSFKVSRQISDISTSFAIQNIPIGKYTIKAALSDGRKLKMSENGPRAGVYEKLGLIPRSATGTSTITFTPSWQSTPVMVASFKSNWDAVKIGLKL